MRGSLGIWAEPLAGIDQPRLPVLELHVNVWRDLPGNRSSIDFGLQLADLKHLQRIFLYIPAPIQTFEVVDLSKVLKVGETLSAVFNDTVEITHHNEGSFDVRRGNGFEFRVFEFKQDADFDIEHVALSDHKIGSVLKFGEAFCERVRESPDSCADIRFRVHLSPSNGEIFYSYTTPPDSWLLSSFYRTELNEFRINERRSFPDVVVKWYTGSEFRIKRVLYFLIRDFRYELLVQHVQFKRTRRLETRIWRDYLAPSRDHKAVAEAGDIGERMLIYQWREDAQPVSVSEGQDAIMKEDCKWIQDFSAFASFRSPKDNIWNYILVIVALSAIGGAIQSVVSASVGYANLLLTQRVLDGVLPSTDTISNAAFSILVISIVLFGVVKLPPVLRWLGNRVARAKR